MICGLEKSHTFGVFGLQKTEVVLPLIADHFAASETANRNDHFACVTVVNELF